MTDIKNTFDIYSPLSLFVTCAKGLENLLNGELSTFGGQQIGETVAGVKVEGDLAFAYRCCLWSRVANKVLLALGQCTVKNAEDLYSGVASVDWSLHLRSDSTLWVDFSGTNEALRNTQFSAQIVKDAIVDQLRTASGQRPSINRERPDLTVNVRLHRGQATINLDLCGESLHKRGYRQQSVVAPLKENLAAALLLRAGWLDIAADGGHLIDPMCGSGTLLTEAAMLVADIAPGIWREEFAFQRWLQHQPEVWQMLKAEAEQRREAGLAKRFAEIRGYDTDPRAVAASKANAERAGLDGLIRVLHKPLAEFTRPSHGDFSKGLLITNPPYGERLGEQQALLPLYGQLGDTLKRDFSGWTAAVFTGNPELGKALGLRSHKQYKLYNGAIASELLLFEVFAKEGRRSTDEGSPAKANQVLSDGARMVANRLQKNLRQLQPWAQARNINCYRVYDADLPEYAAAIDIYGDKVHIQEYQAPASVPENKAQQRLRDLVLATQSVFDLGERDYSIKQRRRTRGKQQYEANENALAQTGTVKTDSAQADSAQVNKVSEGKAIFEVDLWSYLDTGLFLDHRLAREKLASMALGKKLLNLFCYTATATVQAALAGARSSVSVDMSKTYLQWAQRNFDLNNLGKNHQLVQADCLQWLKQCREGFDLIFLDPPSFSNSKRMAGVLDVQRDHVSLIKRCMELLNSHGTLFFSTNLRRFKFDFTAFNQFKIEDISAATIDRDFQRNPKIHQCFLIRHE